MTATLDHTPGRHAADPADTAFLERLHALEVTAVRLAEERNAARAEACGLLRVNLALQRLVNEAKQDQRHAAAETLRANAAEDRVRELEELLADERDITATVPLPRFTAEPEPKRRGRWRR